MTAQSAAQRKVNTARRKDSLCSYLTAEMRPRQLNGKRVQRMFNEVQEEAARLFGFSPRTVLEIYRGQPEGGYEAREQKRVAKVFKNQLQLF